ncbi:MAG: hypothetical protein EOO52_06575 [Gammaproteobacteria bacterium]|nr:MAG: hypothetical protein EOO52_06575 [Gammaproteobacteria bacterium]
MKPSLLTCSHRSIWMFASILALVSCGGGGGSGSSGGQKPDPVIIDFPIAYIERTVPTVNPEDPDEPIYPITDLLRPTAFFPGARVIIKDRASASAKAVDITSDVFKDDPNYDPTDLAKGYDVKDLSVSRDGTKLLFAMHAPLDPDLEEDDPLQTKWHIYEYNLKTKETPRPIITSEIVAEQGHDISPSYLPDGRILFTSTRQVRSKAILLDDGKPQFSAYEEGNDTAAFNLHVMKDDGTGIEQITYNQSHDLQPTVLQNGRILYTHWDQNNLDNLSFYTTNPDGTQVERHYGFISMNIQPLEADQPMNRLLKPQEMLDGRIAAILKPDGALLGGDMVVVDTQHFYENNLQTSAGGGTSTTAQNPISILPVNIKTSETDVSKHGRFSALSPLYDGTQRLLASWSQCRLKEVATNKIVACTDKLIVEEQVVEGYEEAEPFYGLWIYNIAEQSQLPVVLAEEGKMFTEPITLEPRPASTFYTAKTDPALAAENVGLLHIRSVYDMDGQFNAFGSMDFANIGQVAQATPDARPARFIRLIKAVSIPDDETKDNLSDGTYGEEFNDFTGLREIIGYAPVEPDGSVKVKVPADVAFTLEVLDKDGKRISTNHNNWLQVRPGETRECNGCHMANNLTAGHGRSDSEPATINTGAASAGSAAQFPGTKRFDKLGAPIDIVMGETMAELAYRSYFQLLVGTDLVTLQRKPTVDLAFDDEWTELLENKVPSFAYRYSDLATTDENHAPTSEACTEIDGWTNQCRVIINYEQHIQPLWNRERPLFANGAPVLDADNKQINNRCTSCHSNSVTDADGNSMAQVPAGFLELVGTKQNAGDEMLSYTQLLTGSTEQYLDENGGLQSLIPVCSLTVNTNGIPLCTVPPLDENGLPTCTGVAVCQYEQDAVTGALLLDSGGNLIPLTRAIPVAATMSRAGARTSARFFNKFTTTTDSHFGLLNNSELKLLSEWLDLGGAYYNNPFDSIAK